MSKWTKEQEARADEVVDHFWYHLWDESGNDAAMTRTAVELACQRNELLEACKKALSRHCGCLLVAYWLLNTSRTKRR